jgi:predicted ribosome quality control (RQC) complex YloA/Tae2 family protein
MKKTFSKIEDERDEWREKAKLNERKAQEITERQYEMERDVRSMM